MPEVMPYQMPLRHLCNLLQTNSGNIDAVIASLPDVKPEQLEGLKTRCRCAWYWITECAPEDFRFALKTVGTKVELNDTELAAIKKIHQDVLPVIDTLEEKPLSEAIYEVAHQCGLEPKALFTAVYQVLIGKNAGPRLASFMKIIGRSRLEELLGQY
jgi:lysyl-tRNA synthetase class 1